MLIRSEQMKAFQEDARRRFEDEMVVHSKTFSPRLCEVIGDEQLRLALRSAVNRANSYGFTHRGPIRLFIEMTFLRGSAFDTDPQYPAVCEVLRGSGEQMQRAEQIHEANLDYLEKVSGPGGVNVRKALRELSLLTRMPIAFSSGNLIAGLLQEMTRVFPEKVAYSGEAGLKSLVQEGVTEARRHGFDTVRQETLVAVLMFAFGHGCTDDPLFPWIARTLNDGRITSPAARAKRLEGKARTWLEHVLASPGEGLQA